MNAWYKPSSPSDIVPRPWLSDAAIDYLQSLLRSNMIVAEFGGGGSTLWFANRVKHVYTCESDSDWERAIKAIAPDNVTLVNPLPVMPYDLLLIDGEPVEDRAQWIILAPQIVRAGGYVVLDNANRPEYENARLNFQSLATLLYTSPLEGAHLVTEFYQLKG
jgi:predicted O-methyltransferase YrrM